MKEGKKKKKDEVSGWNVEDPTYILYPYPCLVVSDMGTPTIWKSPNIKECDIMRMNRLTVEKMKAKD